VIALALSPSPSHTILRAPPVDDVQVTAAVIAIALAVAAAIIGFKIIRGGRGL
jgi:hypothetical protein